MSGNLYKQNMGFEAEVRRTAEAIWNQEPGSCQPAHYSADPVIRELDGLVRLRDVTHLIMVTTSTKLQKAKDDIKKLNAAEKLERKTAQAVSKWFITREQLDAQHVEHARQNNVTALTLDAFRRRFFDGRSYISKREIAAFGSARNPVDNSPTFEPDAYVSLPVRAVVRTRTPTRGTRTEKESTSVEQLTRELQEGSRVVLLAPFGGGKSLTTREVFRELAKLYREGKTNLVPVVLNLREHWGQDYFDEILERHARSIGFSPREDLVAAWRAGMVTVLLDGFDEVASQSIGRFNEKHFMREARRAALQGVRDLILKLPAGVGLWICGRDHYFDNEKELAHALGLTSEDYILAELDEFTEAGAHDFLKRNGVEHELPTWLPRKPLLLAYLTQHNLLDDVLQIDSSYGFGYAWDHFLSLVMNREAALERAAMEPGTLRSVMERLAFVVRSRPSGSGPITSTDLSDAYAKETGQAAGEAVLAQLQRLPGLTQRDSDPGARSFVDEDMLAALQGGAFAKSILGHFQSQGTFVLSALPRKAITMSAYLLAEQGSTSHTVVSVMERICKEASSGQVDSQLIADAFLVAVEMAEAAELESIDFRGMVVEGAVIGKIDLEALKIANVDLRECVVEEIILGKGYEGWGIRLFDCIVTKISGAAERSALLDKVFDSGCEIEYFDDMGTNNAVLSANIAPELKALITILKKLYKQAGAGRKLAALSRGIGQQDVANCIEPIVSILQREDFVTVFNKVVHPVRRQSSRVEQILAAPSLSDDPVVKAVSQIVRPR